ncbi:Suf-domain-containing protein [Leucogyrophana mollusca]|uniref:Suf-domain-containing protein n=1 Tax=Leucogyrophana mollusca TaxID=85980 RepID=A0ACB8B3N7_9AGAM|nr:Suf-domain-containing protein [Leucogyrophana mollusca]
MIIMIFFTSSPVPWGAFSTVSQGPLSEWHVLRSKLREEPHNPDGWNRLVDLAESAGNTEQIRESYEDLLEIYPNTASAQIAQLNHFLRLGLFQCAEALFKKYLKASPSVELYQSYLSYVRSVQVNTTRDAVIKAYEFALNRIGQDQDSGDIWSDYIQYLKIGETTTPGEESQKMDTLRKVYHCAVQIPLKNVERLWFELSTFEYNLDKTTANKIMLGLSSSHVRACTVLRQLERHQGPLFPPPPQSSSLRSPHYLPHTPTFNAAERALVGAWKTYFKWEESNPLEFEDKDRSALISRIQGVYRKAVIRMRYYSEIWYMAFVWTNSVGKQEDAVNILKAGMEANPTSFLLHFAYAEQIEAWGNHAEVTAMFDKLLDKLHIDLEALKARANSSNSSSSDGSGSTVPANTPAPTTTGLTEAGSHSNNPFFATQSAGEKPPEVGELAERRTEYGLVWITYMRFVRRAQGIKSFRQIFASARRDLWTPWEVYEFAALTEYHHTKEIGAKIAARIFEKGLEEYGDEIQLFVRYLEFLIRINDDINARALFERAVTTFSFECARPLWERWARYEYQYGDLAAVQKLEQRMAGVCPSDSPIKRFAQRHTYSDTDTIAARDLGLAMVIRQPTTLGQPNTSSKRPSSLNYERREGSARPSDSGLPTKRARQRSCSPPRDRDRGRRQTSRSPPRDRARDRRQISRSPPRYRDRDRWDGPPLRRRLEGPGAREREREVERERAQGDDNGPPLPGVLSWFLGQLPSASSFDGPIFRADDMMTMFRNVATGATPLPPPPPAAPPREAGRPLPDYGPHWGPGGGWGGPQNRC